MKLCSFYHCGNCIRLLLFSNKGGHAADVYLADNVFNLVPVNIEEHASKVGIVAMVDNNYIV